jgi:tyrosinase
VGANLFIQVVVRSGESFVTYVARYGVSGHRLRNANQNIADPNLIFPGQIVVVPVVSSLTPSRTTPFFYVVQGGDSVASIAAKFEMDSNVLTQHNPGASFAAGSTILVPAGPHLYTVRQGDNLGIIAERYATTVDFLLTGNTLPDPGSIFPGQLLYVPLQKDRTPVPYN